MYSGRALPSLSRALCLGLLFRAVRLLLREIFCSTCLSLTHVCAESNHTLPSDIFALSLSLCTRHKQKSVSCPVSAMLDSSGDWDLRQKVRPVLLTIAFLWIYASAMLRTTNELAMAALSATFAMALLCGARCCLTEAGDVPSTWNVIQTVGSAVDLASLPAHEVKRSTGRRRVCLKSAPNIFKPDRAHYCARLGKCILMLDHFSSWHDNAVGFHNHKFFLLHALYFALTAVPSAYLAFIAASTNFQLVEAASIAVAALASSGLFCLHAVLAVCNLTSIELFEKRGLQPPEDHVNPYDRGARDNLHSRLGANVLEWALPVRWSCEGDGLTWARREDMR